MDVAGMQATGMEKDVPKLARAYARKLRQATRVASLGVALLFTLAGCGNKPDVVSQTFPETKAECAATAAPNRFIVHWKDGSTSIETAESREDLLKDLVEPNLNSIDFVEHDQVISLAQPAASRALKLHSSELQAMNESADWGQQLIGAPSAWQRGFLGAGTIVAVIDSGADITHLQLINQLAINSKEIPGNQIDDDRNGLVDDVNGFDFQKGSSLVTDESGHGTHVSGIIVGEHLNSLASPVRGIAPGAKLIPLDFMSADGSGNISEAIVAMKYAVSRGARVINASWGGAPCSESLRRAIQSLEPAGVLFVSAAGNSGVSLDLNPEYPAAYSFSGQLTVGASTARDYMAGFSNYSYNLVHLMAPGAAIVSLFPGNRAVSMSGTSMAAPFVAGAAAVLMGARPQATVRQIRTALLASVDRGSFAVASGGRLNLNKALDELLRMLP